MHPVYRRSAPRVPPHSRRVNDPAPPPVIRPNPLPFPFEAELQRVANDNVAPLAPRPAPVPVAAPPSHHQPIMGLGGGLISLNRQMAIERANRQREEEQRQQRPLPPRGIRLFNLSGLANLWRNAWLYEDDLYDDPEDHDYNPNYEHIFDELFGGRDPAWPYAPRSGTSALRHPGGNEHFYKPMYTHPEKPNPGFTFDFSPPELPSTSGASSSTVIVLDDAGNATAGPSSNAAADSSTAIEATTTLVCAHCMDPLVLSTNSAAPEEERKNRKVYALRCGHMFDGKCIMGLMRPASRPPPPETPPEYSQDLKGKGKGSAHTDGNVDLTRAETQKAEKGTEGLLGKRARGGMRKGKGKAAESPDNGIYMPGSFPAGHLASEPPAVDNNPMLSRLRPRHPQGSSNTSPVWSADIEAPFQTVPVARPIPPLPRRRGRAPARGKGKGRVKKSIIEAVYEWTCPIPGCGHEHTSICVDGEWKMDPERGAIGVFV